MAKDYKVGNPTLETNISDIGTGFTKSWKVPYQITDGPAKGTVGHVSIPADQYDADTVHSAISQAVKVHHEVMGA